MEVYVELDCLLDTRLGTVSTIDNKAGEQLIAGGKYYSRWHDRIWELCAVSEVKYSQDYGWRDKETLKHSKTTLVYKALNDVLFDEHDKYMRGIIHKAPSVTVNIYPYDVDKKSIELLLSNLLVTPWITVISENPEKLPPWEIGKKYTHIWQYDFDTYLKPFYRELGEKGAGTAIYHFPALARGKNKQGVTDAQLVDGIMRLSENMRGVMTVLFEPVYNYCFHLHTTPLKTEEESTE